MDKLLSILKKNNLQVFLSLLGIFYFTFPMLILYDTAHYMNYVLILENKVPFVTWDIIRGPVFPILIYLGNLFFGKTTMGLLFLSFGFYLVMLSYSRKIVDLFSDKSNRLKIVLYILFLLLVILNPIIFGYYHSLLTEFVAISISVMSCYIAWKLLFVKFSENKLGYIIIAVFFIIATPFGWFLKQPYISISIFPLVASVVISFFTSKSRREKFEKSVILILSFLSLILSLFAWNKVLEAKGVQTDSSRSSSNVLVGQLIMGLGDFDIIEDFEFSEKTLADSRISKSEKKALQEEDRHYMIVEVYNRKKELIDYMLINTSNEGSITSISAFNFVIKSIIQHPLLVMESYLTNYLGITNIFVSTSEDGVGYYVKQEFQPLGCNENCAIAIGIINKKSNIYYMPDDYYSSVINYEQYSHSPYLFRSILSLTKSFSIIVFNYSLLILPLVWMASIAYVVLYRKVITQLDKNIMSMVIILLSYSLFHIFVHVANSALLDRYASPAFITTILGYLGIMCILIRNRHIKKV